MSALSGYADARELTLDHCIEPDWPAPKCVKSVITTRIGGVSRVPFRSMNLGDHVGDLAGNVQQNRDRLAQMCGLDASHMHWLKQVHGTDIVQIDQDFLSRNAGAAIVADGSTTMLEKHACLVMTADCLPVLLCDEAGERVAAVHAGWRGLAAGVLTQALRCFSDASKVMAYLGPAISQTHFEVGAEVREQFLQLNPRNEEAFEASETKGKFYADLYDLAYFNLLASGVQQVHGGDFCTYAEQERFFSFRRDGERSGRMASLIYIDRSSDAF